MEGPRPPHQRRAHPPAQTGPGGGRARRLPSCGNRWLGGEEMQKPDLPERLGRGGVSAARAVRWSTQDRDGALGSLQRRPFPRAQGALDAV